MLNPINSNGNSDSGTKKTRQADNANPNNRIKEALAGREGKWLAQAAGLPASSISDYLNGRSPRIDAAIKMARALDVDIEWLFGDQIDRRQQLNERPSLMSAADADWVEIGEYSLLEIDEHGRLSPIVTTLMRKDWLYSSLGVNSGLWITRLLTPYDPLQLNRGTMLFCQDVSQGERLLNGMYYLFRINGGIVMAPYALRDLGNNEPTVTPRDIGHDEDQYQAVARVVGQLARPL